MSDDVDLVPGYTKAREILRRILLMQKEIWFLAALVLLVASGGWAMFTRIDDSLQRIDSRLAAVEIGLARVEERLTVVEDRLGDVEEELKEIKEKPEQ